MHRVFLLLLVGFGFSLSGPLPLCAQSGTQILRVTVSVSDPAGAAVRHAQIKLTPLPATVGKNIETNESGEALLDVPPGSYQLFAASPEFAPWVKRIKVEANSTQTFRVVLQPAESIQTLETCSPCPMIRADVARAAVPAVVPSASIVIVITSADGAPVPHAQIGGFPQATASKPYEADESGRFSLKLFPGAYDVAVTSPGLKRWTKHIEIKKNENQTLNVVLGPGSCEPCVALN